MPDEEYRYELENRIKNLLWTVSGDYALEVSLILILFSVLNIYPSMTR